LALRGAPFACRYPDQRGRLPGLNAVIRWAVLKGIKADGHTFVGFRDGWRGVVDGDVLELPRDKVRGISKQGGTILGTSRTKPFDGLSGGTLIIKSTLDSLGVDALITIGGKAP
jgi:6-phosphofructokinase 1